MKQYENAGHWNKAAQAYKESAHKFTSLFAADALQYVTLDSQSNVLDVAAGTGALALEAAKTGAQVTAIDFSPGMVASLKSEGVQNIDALEMDGQSLKFSDNSFDITFSVFGVIMFPDWQKGLAEMSRVTKRGGHCVVTTWKTKGAATFLLLNEVREKLFPDSQSIVMPAAMQALNSQDAFVQAFKRAGFRDAKIHTLTHDFLLNISDLDHPNRMFGMSSDWTSLTDEDQLRVVEEVRRMFSGENVLPIPSTALIGVAER
ncbi:class I SAM-dependent methyltransferase [Litorimonas haliclonae]|uniref:class I SAM-dependent methyltransferase n=1 Tax=Litorimonas haliclonae TaxID=2081977 RepID=UPI0039F13120